MPELPEVETIVRDLGAVLKGLRFLGINSSHDNHIAGALDNAPLVVDEAVSSVERRGKFIQIFFENDFVMTVHLRMSGRLLFRDANEEALKYERTRIDFSGGTLRFCDMRKFGKVWISKVGEHEEETGVSRLGVEPLNGDLDEAGFIGLMAGQRGAVKKCLLDQSVVAGIGNIYADEACFYAGIRPDADVAGLNEEQLERLFLAVIKALKQGIKNRGTSISDYADAFGKTGRNQELLMVYGRGSKECLRCGKILKKVRVAGRGTVYCETCQA